MSAITPLGYRKTHIFDLPRELMLEIIKRLASIDYDSIPGLSRTCHYMRDCCQEFVKHNPRHKFKNPFYLDDGSSCSDDDYWDDLTDSFYDEDELEDLFDDVDRLSMGSNYDDRLDDNPNGPNRDYDYCY